MRNARADKTQPEIMAALRTAGMQVQSLHTVGQGVPDLLVGWKGGNYLLECKTGERDCDRKLTADETAWHEKWAGQVAIVSTPEEAVRAVIRAHYGTGPERLVA